MGNKNLMIALCVAILLTAAALYHNSQSLSVVFKKTTAKHAKSIQAALRNVLPLRWGSQINESILERERQLKIQKALVADFRAAFEASSFNHKPYSFFMEGGLGAVGSAWKCSDLAREEHIILQTNTSESNICPRYPSQEFDPNKFKSYIPKSVKNPQYAAKSMRGFAFAGFANRRTVFPGQHITFFMAAPTRRVQVVVYGTRMSPFKDPKYNDQINKDPKYMDPKYNGNRPSLFLDEKSRHDRVLRGNQSLPLLRNGRPSTPIIPNGKELFFEDDSVEATDPSLHTCSAVGGCEWPPSLTLQIHENAKPGMYYAMYQWLEYKSCTNGDWISLNGFQPSNWADKAATPECLAKTAIRIRSTTVHFVVACSIPHLNSLLGSAPKATKKQSDSGNSERIPVLRLFNTETSMCYNVYGGHSCYLTASWDEDGNLTHFSESGAFNLGSLRPMTMMRPAACPPNNYVPRFPGEEWDGRILDPHDFEAHGVKDNLFDEPCNWAGSVHFSSAYHGLETCHLTTDVFPDVSEEYLSRFPVVSITGKHEYWLSEAVSAAKKYVENGGLLINNGFEFGYALMKSNLITLATPGPADLQYFKPQRAGAVRSIWEFEWSVYHAVLPEQDSPGDFYGFMGMFPTSGGAQCMYDSVDQRFPLPTGLVPPIGRSFGNGIAKVEQVDANHTCFEGNGVHHDVVYPRGMPAIACGDIDVLFRPTEESQKQAVPPSDFWPVQKLQCGIIAVHVRSGDKKAGTIVIWTGDGDDSSEKYVRTLLDWMPSKVSDRGLWARDFQQRDFAEDSRREWMGINATKS